MSTLDTTSAADAEPTASTRTGGSDLGSGPSGGGGRLLSLDVMRGLIMVLMAIDHASALVARRHSSEFWGMGQPVYENGFQFLTRAVTHLCAPGFFLLMGAGMALLAVARTERAGWSDRRVTRFFVSRGALLIVLQLLIENPAWLIGMLTADPGAEVQRGAVAGGGTPIMLHFGVLYGLGATMVVWGLLMRVRTAVVVAISAAAILATQILTPGAEDAARLFPWWMRMLVLPGHSDAVQVFYPLVPWMGVAGLGIVLGRALSRGDASRVLARAAWIGVASLGAFFAIRIAGGFGNLNTPGESWIGFFNVTKYPPSLAFLTLTLGVNLLLLGGFHAMRGWLERVAARPLLVFGRTALFFYILHLYVYALMGVLLPGGTSTAMIYPVWLLGLLILYPACVRYERFRRNRPVESIWRMF